MEYNFADRVSIMKPSKIRELFKLTNKEGMISFAGGFPATELFPVEEIENSLIHILKIHKATSLQYSSTEGDMNLRKWIANKMEKDGLKDIGYNNIMLSNGAQQGIDLTAKLFLNPNDYVICENPTYPTALTAFKSYECNFIGIPSDEEGMLISELEKVLQEKENVKLIYINPDFQNPTGKVLGIDRRRKIVEIADKYGVIILEDNPYRDLRYEGCDLPPIKAFDKKGNVVYLGSFSKILAPGLRVGWIVANEELLNKYSIAKQSTDLQCNTLSQYIISNFVEENRIEKHLSLIQNSYKKRRDIAIECIKEYFPKEVTYTKPEGGFFIWFNLPLTKNADDILKICLTKDIAFISGNAFYCDNPSTNNFRINFSSMSEDSLRYGLKVLGSILTREIGI